MEDDLNFKWKTTDFIFKIPRKIKTALLITKY